MVCLKCDHRRPKAASSSETSENQLENVGHREDSRLRFVKDDHTNVNIQTSPRQHRHKQYNSTNMGRSWEEDSEDISYPNLRNEDSGFVDFPIAGGKSDLSQNEGKRDRWKSEMLERSKGTFKAEKEDNELRTASIQRRFEFPKSAADEEMAEWFGSGKLEKRLDHGSEKLQKSD